MKQDISSRKDIKHIVVKFYDKLLEDEKMFPFFKEFVEQNQLGHHLEIITNFWSDILLDTLTYKNNVLQKHLDKNIYLKFKEEHFVIWVSYFNEIINTFFIGLNAEKMKARAQSIATVMKLKMNIYK